MEEIATRMPSVETHDRIIVVGVKDQALRDEYGPCGAWFLTVEEALDVRYPDGVRLMLVVQDSVTPEQKKAVKRRADSRRVSCVFVMNVSNIAQTLGNSLTNVGLRVQGTNSEREYVLSRIPEGHEFNVARVAKSIRVRTHIDGLPYLEYNQIRKWVGQVRTQRRKLVAQQKAADSSGRILKWKSRQSKPDPIAELLDGVKPMPITPELEEKVRRATGRCNTPEIMVKRLFNPSAGCSDESQTKTLLGLIRGNGFMHVRAGVVFRAVAKQRKLAKELAVK